MNVTLECRVKASRAYTVGSYFKAAARNSFSELYGPNRRVVSLKPEKSNGESVLLSYVIDPFLLKPHKPIPNSHSNFWESILIAQTFSELGYCVDVINWANGSFLPLKDYSFLVDSRFNLQRLAPILSRDCIKLFHIDVCHTLTGNAAEAERLLELQRRKGITLRPRRFEYPNQGIECADFATVLGNRFTMDSFRYAGKMLFPVPIISPETYPWPEGKDFESCRNRFLWFGSSGLVRKGLDLVLEAFAKMPDLHLTVCGPIHGDSDFEAAFRQELYNCPNIRTEGWVNISSSKFTDITNSSAALVFPSSAEGQAGSVATCMQAGLIPIISFETGYDNLDFGFCLTDCTVEKVIETVRKVASLPSATLREMARRAWCYARANHTKEKFAEDFRKAVTTILTIHGNESCWAPQKRGAFA